MQDKATLMQEFDTARQKLRAVLPDVDVKTEVYPGWTVKEMLAHLAGWDDATIVTLRAHNRGEKPKILALRGINFYNAQVVAERAGLKYEQIVQEWELVREELKTILNEMPAERIGDVLVSPWGPMLTVAQLITVMTEHEEEHAADLRELTSKRQT